ncbi:FGGY-family carbohydrate kinase [Brytella acorum]|uniref:Carbohydrate kinase n=1 Tax=Brytella acorum TaxID=2959299 RepID=A0AA35VDL1_9PROT|nr:FGGY-family carbohydrate kinase [Brytella acorum]MDF3625699.1 carbohydrate kinase [Brytella acorum]CAI9121328.1 carbohydrate kinase [Brytella acorum]
MTKNGIIGVDCGSTSTKAVIFSATGEILGTGRCRVAQHMERAHHVERDPGEAWQAAASAIRDALADAGLDGRAIMAVGVTAHGDGLFVLDRTGHPLGRGIMSLDSRAQGLHEHWRAEGTLDRVFPIAGQRPYRYSATALLAWMRDNEPERYHAIGTAFFAKDWIRLCLTGRIATDLTEASTAFTDLHTQDYSDAILAMLGLSPMRGALPELLLPCDPAGTVSAAAASATGLLEGTPVSAGLHDVTAAAIGLGHTRAGDMSVTAGTFSINEIFHDAPVPGDEWACRAGYRRGLWNCMSISPGSASNLEWLARLLCPDEPAAAATFMRAAASRYLARGPVSGEPLFHPYLFGSPYEAPASASLFGLQAWHGRDEIVQALLQGIAFNHRYHVDALRRSGVVRRIGIAGGGTSEAGIAQMFADVFGETISVSNVREAGALGAALTGAVAVGMFPDLETAVEAQDVELRAYQPEPSRAAIQQDAYERYSRLVEAVKPHWDGLYGMGTGPDAGFLPGVPVVKQEENRA